MMKSYKIIILSENFIFSNVIAAFLENKSFGFESVKAVGFTEFFSEKIAAGYKMLFCTSIVSAPSGDYGTSET